MVFTIRIFFPAIFFLVLFSCKYAGKKKGHEDFNYRSFKDSISVADYDTGFENSNLFDTTVFTPGTDSLDLLLLRIDELWKTDIEMMLQLDTLLKVWKKTGDYTAEELSVIQENVRVLDTFLLTKNAGLQSACVQKDCLLYAEVIKSNQTLYLYLNAELIDSFQVSSGLPAYETPEMDLRPSGPLFKKYTSKKFPGGNFQGLGNMPYVVFIKGGYAIHGTTTGNFSRLGNRASHGCIRLHPLNARIFYELVNRIGLENTWVTIKDSLP